MKKLTADVIKESVATTGTGIVTLLEVVGWARFADRFANNDRVYYSLRDGNNWEVGFGTYVAPNQLDRTTVLGTLNAGTWTDGGAALNLSGQSVARAVAPETMFTNAWRVEPTLVAANTPLVAGGCYLVQGNSLTLTLPTAPAIGDRVQVQQAMAGVTGTVVNPGAEKINGVAGSMTVDVTDFAFTLVYVNAAYGWKVS